MELLQKKGELVDRQRAIVNAAKTDIRELTEDESKEFDTLNGQITTIDNLIAKDNAVAAREAVMDAPVNQPYRPAYAGAGSPSLANTKKDDGGFSNLGEFLSAVRFGDKTGRIVNWQTGDGQTTGYRLPEQFRDDLLMIQPEASIVRPRANVIPAGEPADGKITLPAFTQGANGAYGGVSVSWIGEGAAKPPTDGATHEVSLEPKEVAAHTVVTDKLLRNWQAANAFISNLLRGAMVAAEDYAFLRGDGNGKPTGVMGGTGTLAVNRTTASKIVYADLVAMIAKLLPESVGDAIWVVNQSAMPQIVTLKDDAGNSIFIQGDATKGIPTTLAGIPIRFTGKTPVLGVKGDVQLLDLRYYLIKDGSGPFVAASEHVQFVNNKTVIKAFWNVDGKGWVKDPLKLEDNTTTVSPYVILDVPAA